jgi:tripartite-type tricarboxylate transporter receptor subunit TctC
MKRRELLAAGAAVLPLLARAQVLSKKPIRIVVPFGPGGVADLTARAVAGKLSDNLGQGVIVENRPGAGGIAAAQTVVQSAPDGHTLFLMSNGTAVTAGLFKTLPFDPVKDLAPVATLGFFDLAVLESAKGKFQSMRELLAFAKAHPGKLNVGTIAIGSTQQLAAELLKTSAGVDFTIVPFNGTPAVMTSLQAGDIDVAVEIVPPVMGQITAKALRPLAVMGLHRSANLPGVPTVAESGVAGFDVASWNALAAPARTPPEVIAFLNREVLKALADPQVGKQLASLSVDARGSTPEQLKALLASEIKRWSEVIQRANVPRQ